jgi:hypothetical protein
MSDTGPTDNPASPPLKTAINAKGERLGLAHGEWMPSIPDGFALEEPPLPEGFKLEARRPDAASPFTKTAINAKGERMGLASGEWLPPIPDGFALEEPPLPEGFRLEETPTMDVLKSAGSGVARGAAGAIGTPGDAASLLNRGLNAVNDFLGPKLGYTPEEIAKTKASGSPIFPTSGDVRDAIESKTGKFYEPQTTAAKYVGAVSEFLPGAVAGPVAGARELAANIFRLGIVPGLASEAAGQATEGTSLEPWARTAAALAAPGAAARAVTPFPFRGPAASAAAHADAVATLRREGVHVSAGQEADNQRLKFLENDLNPEAGKETLEGFTRATTRTAGAETPVVIHGKGGTVDELRKEVGGRFDALATGNTLHADPQMGLELNDLRNKYMSIPGAYDDATVKALHGAADHVMDLMRANGGAVLTGEQYQTLRSRLNSAAMSAEGQKATALHDFVDVLDSGMERSIAQANPADAGAFPKARADYRKALVLEKAATSAGESAARGYITPAQLERAAKSVYGARQYETGRTPFSELGNAGGAQALAGQRHEPTPAD